MDGLIARLWINTDDIYEAVSLLDENFIDNDIDDGDRIMVSEDDLDEAITILEDAGFDVDVI